MPQGIKFFPTPDLVDPTEQKQASGGIQFYSAPEHIPSRAPVPEQSDDWFTMGNAIRTVPPIAAGLLSAPFVSPLGGMAVGAGVSGASSALADWYEGKEFNPYQTAAQTVLGGATIPGMGKAINWATRSAVNPAAAAIERAFILPFAGAAEGALLNTAGGPVSRWAETGEITAPNTSDLVGGAVFGAGAGLAAGTIPALRAANKMRTLQPAPPVESAPPPSPSYETPPIPGTGPIVPPTPPPFTPPASVAVDPTIPTPNQGDRLPRIVIRSDWNNVTNAQYAQMGYVGGGIAPDGRVFRVIPNPAIDVTVPATNTAAIQHYKEQGYLKGSVQADGMVTMYYAGDASTTAPFKGPTDAPVADIPSQGDIQILKSRGMNEDVINMMTPQQRAEAVRLVMPSAEMSNLPTREAPAGGFVSGRLSPEGEIVIPKEKLTDSEFMSNLKGAGFTPVAMTPDGGGIFKKLVKDTGGETVLGWLGRARQRFQEGGFRALMGSDESFNLPEGTLLLQRDNHFFFASREIGETPIGPFPSRNEAINAAQRHAAGMESGLRNLRAFQSRNTVPDIVRAVRDVRRNSPDRSTPDEYTSLVDEARRTLQRIDDPGTLQDTLTEIQRALRGPDATFEVNAVHHIEQIRNAVEDRVRELYTNRPPLVNEEFVSDSTTPVVAPHDDPEVARLFELEQRGEVPVGTTYRESNRAEIRNAQTHNELFDLAEMWRNEAARTTGDEQMHATELFHLARNRMAQMRPELSLNSGARYRRMRERLLARNQPPELNSEIPLQSDQPIIPDRTETQLGLPDIGSDVETTIKAYHPTDTPSLENSGDFYSPGGGQQRFKLRANWGLTRDDVDRAIAFLDAHRGRLSSSIDHSFAESTLPDLPKGKPGLEIQYPSGRRDPTSFNPSGDSVNVIFRDSNGKPVAFASGVTGRGDDKLSGRVDTLVADKNRGRLYGDAVEAVGATMARLGAILPSGSYSRHTDNIIRHGLLRAIGEDPGPVARRARVLEGQGIKGLEDELPTTTAARWESKLRDLDEWNAPDEDYRYILVRNNKPLRQGETWRSRVQKGIDFFKSRMSELPGEEEGALYLGDMFKGAREAGTQLKDKMSWGEGENRTNYIREALAIPSGATTTGDLSGSGRQGLPMILTPEFWKAQWPQLKAGWDREMYDEIHNQLRSKEIFQPRIDMNTGKELPSFADEIGLKLMQVGSDVNIGQREEATASRWLETGGSIPYFSAAYRNTAGRYVRGSNRAFATLLNHIRVNRAEKLLNYGRAISMEALAKGSARPGILRQSFTPEEAIALNPYTNKELAKEIVDFVNTATGRAPLKTHVIPGKEVNLERYAKGLSSVLFSPRLMASRIRLLNPSTYVMASPQVRKEYLRSALGAGAAWYTVTQLAKLAGGEDVSVNDDPNSADFGKIRIGNTRIDPGGGFQQFLVMYHRLWSGKYTSSSTGKSHDYGAGFNAPATFDALVNFGTNKLNPVAKFAVDISRATQYNPFHVADRTAQLFVPLIIQDAMELYNEEPDLMPGLFELGAATVGMGTQVYEKGESISKFVDPENDKLITGGGIRNIIPGLAPSGPVRRR